MGGNRDDYHTIILVSYHHFLKKPKKKTYRKWRATRTKCLSQLTDGMQEKSAKLKLTQSLNILSLVKYTISENFLILIWFPEKLLYLYLNVVFF